MNTMRCGLSAVIYEVRMIWIDTKKIAGSRCWNRLSVRGGGYLLSHFRSIIDVVRFNFSVRNGKRWSPHAIATLVRCASGLYDRACKVKKRRGSDWSNPYLVTWSPEALSSFAFPDVLCAIEIVFCFVFGIAPKKGFGRLVSLGYARYRACTCDLSTSSS